MLNHKGIVHSEAGYVSLKWGTRKRRITTVCAGYTFHCFSTEAGLLDKLFSGIHEKEVQRFFSGAGNDYSQKGRPFTTPFEAGWRIEVSEVSK